MSSQGLLLIFSLLVLLIAAGPGSGLRRNHVAPSPFICICNLVPSRSSLLLPLGYPSLGSQSAWICSISIQTWAVLGSRVLPPSLVLPGSSLPPSPCFRLTCALPASCVRSVFYSPLLASRLSCPLGDTVLPVPTKGVDTIGSGSGIQLGRARGVGRNQKT